MIPGISTGGGGLSGGDDSSAGDLLTTISQSFGGISTPPLRPKGALDQLPQLVAAGGLVLLGLYWLKRKG